MLIAVCLAGQKLGGRAMRQYVAGVLVLGLLAGCTADWDSSRTSAKGLALRSSRPETANLQDHRSDPAAAARIGARSARGFASLADRGELLAYAMPRDQRLAQKPGAAYQVRLSEEHAFNAAHEGGRIVVPLPDGGSAALTYERHVEHPDGNWSWIGRDENGADAVITFGEKAAFGSIPQSDGESWRLTTAAGRSWLAKNDRNRIAAMGSGKRASTDALVPPDAAGDASQSESPGAHSNITMVATDEALAAVTVDVLVGYTNGLAAALGGQSQAVTRINNLVDITNQAYANSGVNATVRLVGAQQVTYPDATDNGVALEEVSGQTQTGPTTPSPAFAALRAARDTLSADLVVLLRDFQSPENNGCGIAWLIGSGQTGIEQADAPYGYSVVSDGSDMDGGDTFFCRDESFAHEIGHNMGQAHNAENSTSSGVHSYSYGYRETFSTGFYTIMAYALTGANQTGIRYFANPNVTFNGRPTGSATADNVRSMNQVLATVASFRGAAGTPQARNDVNGDGKSDLLWSNPGTGQFVHWLMNGSTFSSTGVFPVDGAYDAIGAGDIDGNGLTDIIWRHRSNGLVYAWMRSAAGYSVQYITTTPAPWTLVGLGDVNGDGKADMLWSNPSAGLFIHWLMNGWGIAGSGSFGVDGNYDVIGTGDIDGNGLTDIIWRHRSNGLVYAWMRSASGYSVQYITTTPAPWTLVGVGDVNRDGKADLLWSNPGAGSFIHWLMNGWGIAGTAAFSVDGNYDVTSSGDLDGNGAVDLVWRHRSNGLIYAWMSNGSTYSVQYIYTLSGWTMLK